MISALRSCPKCGWEIPVDAPEGGCPGCLLENGLRLLEEEGQTSNAQRPTSNTQVRGHGRPSKSALLSGELGDYELLEEVGRGGQGVVFRARQKSLNRIVALKVISLTQWASEAHLKRFRREAEAAASLADPGIVPIYEVGERDGSCYFSMQFIDGGQLDQVVKRAPMSIRQVAELTAKVARTVNYAHEHGILHRDIKPGNILLDQAGEPHLTDFGLARLVETESTITRTLDVLGTPSYMAPEQATGKNAELTSATDVYGLGAVLYQLLTNHPPFVGGSTYETIKLLLDTEPRPPRSLNPRIDRDLSAICLKCLEKDPARRYSSALAMAEDLEHWLRHEPIRAKRSGFFVRAHKWVQRKPAIAALAASLIALATAVGWNMWRSDPVARPGAKSIAVLPFDNLSPDPDNAYFADGIQEEILTLLAKIADLRVISRTSTKQYQGKPRNLRGIARELGVANILEGSVQKAANNVRVSVQLVNTETDSQLWADRYDRKLTDMFAVQSQIAREIADALRLNLTIREKEALAVKPTNNAEAYEAYLRGLALETQFYSAYSTDLLKEVSGFYQRAVQLDPRFAVAWARLSRVDAVLYFNRSDDDPAVRRDAAQRALENAQKLDPDLPETLLAAGYYQYWVLRDYTAAKTTFTRVIKILPNSSEVLHALARVTRREGHWAESIVYSDQALALDPRNVELSTNAAWTRAMLRQIPAALTLCDRALEIKPYDPDVMALKGCILQAQGNLQEAAKFVSEINELTPNDDTFVIKITQLRLERKYGEAVRLLQTRLTQFRFASEDDKGRDQVTLALMQRLGGDTAGARITAEQARDTLAQLPNDAFIGVNLSQAYAVMDQKNMAIENAQHAMMVLPPAKDAVKGPSSEENLALIQTTFGDTEAAIETLRRLLQIPYSSWLYGPSPVTPALLRLDPFWDPLRADSAFQKLCKEKQP